MNSSSEDSDFASSEPLPCFDLSELSELFETESSSFGSFPDFPLSPLTDHDIDRSLHTFLYSDFNLPSFVATEDDLLQFPSPGYDSSPFSEKSETAPVSEKTDNVFVAPGSITSVLGSSANKRKAKDASHEANTRRKDNEGYNYGFTARSRQEAVEDGYEWRKYGTKYLKGSTHPRNYYRCSVDKCGVKKMIERNPKDDGSFNVTYRGFHNHISLYETKYRIVDL